MPRKPHGERSRWWRSNGSARTGAFGATVTLRGWDGFVWLLQSRSPHGGTARGVGTHDAKAPHDAEPGVGDARYVASATVSQGVREPGGVRTAEYSEPDRLKRATVNRHAPFASSLSRANGGRRTRDFETRFGGARARPPSSERAAP